MKKLLLLIGFMLIGCALFGQTQYTFVPSAGTVSTQSFGAQLFSVTYANLPAESNGTVIYCSNCIVQTACASGGTGAYAVGIAGSWNCSLTSTGGGGGTSPGGSNGSIQYNSSGSFAGLSVVNNAFLTASGGVPAFTPAASSAGALLYFGGTTFSVLAGNSVGTQCLTENASGVPAWSVCGGGGGGAGLSGAANQLLVTPISGNNYLSLGNAVVESTGATTTQTYGSLWVNGNQINGNATEGTSQLSELRTSLVDGIAYIDYENFISPADVYTAYPSFQGTIHWQQNSNSFGNNVAMPASPFLNTQIASQFVSQGNISTGLVDVGCSANLNAYTIYVKPTQNWGWLEGGVSQITLTGVDGGNASYNGTFTVQNSGFYVHTGAYDQITVTNSACTGTAVDFGSTGTITATIPASQWTYFDLGTCSGATPLPAGDYFVGYYIFIDAHGNQVLTPPAASQHAEGGSFQCLQIEGNYPFAPYQPAGAVNFQVYGEACSAGGLAACLATTNGMTLQATSAGVNLFHWPVSQQKLSYSTPSSVAATSTFSPGQQSGPTDQGLIVDGITVQLYGADYVTPEQISIGKNSTLKGIGQKVTTLQLGQGAPNAIAVGPIPYGSLTSGGSGSASNALMASLCLFSSGVLMTCSQPYVFPPFSSTCSGSGNCQITVTNPEPPYLQVPWHLSTQYWVGSVITSNGGSPDVWQATSISGTGISSSGATFGGFNSCTSAGATYIDGTGGITWTCKLKAVTAAAISYSVGQEIWDGNLQGNYHEVVACSGSCTSSGAPALSPYLGGTVVDNPGANQVTFQNIGQSGVVSPSYQWATVAGTISNSVPYPTGTLNLSGSQSYLWSGCSSGATCPSGTTTLTTILYTTGGGAAIPSLTISTTTPPTGIYSGFSSAGNAYVRYAWATASGVTPWFGPSNGINPSSSQCISVPAPSNPPLDAIGWVIYDGGVDYNEFLHEPDGVTLIPGTGTISQYVPNLPYAQLIPIGIGATICGPNPGGATFSVGLNTTDTIVSLGGQSPIGFANSNAGAYASTIEDLSIEAGRGLTVIETYGLSVFNDAAQEHSGIFGVTSNDACGGDFYFLGAGAQNSSMRDIKDAGANCDYKVGTRIETVPVFRGVDGATASGPVIGTQWFTRCGIQFIFPWWNVGSFAVPSGQANSFYAEAADSVLCVDNMPANAFTMSSASGTNRHPKNIAEIGFTAHDVTLADISFPILHQTCAVHNLLFDGANACGTSSDGTANNSSQYVASYYEGNVGGYASLNETLCSSDQYIGCYFLSQAFGSLTDGATVTWSPVGGQVSTNLLFTTHGGSRTLVLSNLKSGSSYNMTIKQDATGGEGLTLTNGNCSGGNFLVGNGGSSAVSLSTGPSAIDVLTLTFNGTNCIVMPVTKNFD